MNRQKIIKSCVSIVSVCSLIALINVKVNALLIPSQSEMVDVQSNLFTISSVFAGFGFSILGLVLGLFSERIAVKLKGTSLIQRKCDDIVKSIIFFCCSGAISLLFILGANVFITYIFNETRLVNNVLYINGVGFLFMGMFQFLLAVRDFLMIIEKLYGLKDRHEVSKIEYENSKNLLKEKRREMEQRCEDEW